MRGSTRSIALSRHRSNLIPTEHGRLVLLRRVEVDAYHSSGREGNAA